MNRFIVITLSTLIFAGGLETWSQSTASQTVRTTVPRLVRFSGNLRDLDGNPLSGVYGIIFALYSEQTGGAPLWLETQNVAADHNGRYIVLLGSTKPDGLPAELFTSEQARWVGVQIFGQPERPRVLLVSAPYALKAGDAETLGGLPPSAFVLAMPPTADASTVTPAPVSNGMSLQPANPSAVDVTTAGGTVNALPLWDSTSDITSSAITQTGTGTSAKVGIGVSAPATTLDVKGSATIRGTLALANIGKATTTTGFNSQPMTMTASAYSSSLKSALGETFQWQVEPSGNNSATTGGTLNLLFAQGTSKPSETGLQIANNGLITFATGQPFPGIPDLNGSNVFTGNESVSGSIADTSTSGVSIVGNTSSATGIGVEGNVTATTGKSAAVYGTTASDSGYGVEGASQFIGVYGAASGASQQGTHVGSYAGVWGDTGGSADFGFAGVLGTADANYAGLFWNTGNLATVWAENDSSSTQDNILIAYGGSTGKLCTIDVESNLTCQGKVTTAATIEGGRQVSLYGVQAAANWFEDAGSAQLANGSARILLDPTFAQTVNTGIEYHVFLTPKGDCEGLYVDHESAQGFEVHELHGGHSNVAFDYRIMAKRAGYETLRLADVTQNLRSAQLQHDRAARAKNRAATLRIEPH